MGEGACPGVGCHIPGHFMHLPTLLCPFMRQILLLSVHVQIENSKFETQKYGEIRRPYTFVPIAVETLGIFGD